MNAEVAWTKIVTSLKESPAEVATVTKNKKSPIWFTAYTENGEVHVQSAITNKPSAKIAGFRKLSRDEFIRVYPYYRLWAKGECQRQEIRNISVNTSYIFALIARFE